MNNEEPQLTQIANLQISHEGHKLPEQAQVASCSIPRPFMFSNLINQWQPMGIRVVLNLPFIGNDKDFIFAIRNGPFIPRFDRVYKDAAMYNSAVVGDDITINSYAFNNMKNVLHATKSWTAPPKDVKQSIYITYYDYPPLLAQLSLMFRKWRGTMEYRIRTVSGFSTQGYLFAGMLRNVPSYVGVFDQYKVLNSVARQDNSYREVMQNSYVMSDTSMFRHFKVSAPYEYPSPWYDQFRWIANRSRPSEMFVKSGAGDKVTATNSTLNEPHGDNFIVIGMRGSLNTSVNQAQISFELEYRAGEDFQFSDPGLPVGDFLTPYSSAAKGFNSVTYPDTAKTSDGIGIPTGITPAARMAAAVALPNVPLPKINTNIRLPSLPKPRRSRRDTEDSGVDDAEDTYSNVSENPDFDDFPAMNLRKSMR